MTNRGAVLILSTALSAEGIVLVLQANSTQREAARKAKERLESAKIWLWAAVLNKRTFSVPEFADSNIYQDPERPLPTLSFRPRSRGGGISL